MEIPYIDIHTHSTPHNAITLSSWGIHPWCAEEVALPFDHTPFAECDAVGEIGLDYICKVDKATQQYIFEAQLQIAQDLDKIVVIHCVRAHNEVLAILKHYSLRCVIFHGFIGSKELMRRIIQRGYYISYGERTLSSPKTIEALSSTPIERLFLETDTSTLSINEIYTHISTLCSIDKTILRDTIYDNYKKILNI
ncbi:MAG: TatD family hydrolase [Rikenellaceae bacterium]